MTPCPHRPASLSRRGFLAAAGSCGAHLAWMAATSSLGARRAFAAETRGRVVAEEPWGRLEQLHDGVWAIVSTPLESNDWTTLANGGIVAGSQKVLVIESFARGEGAAWAAARALELTGRRPTDVVITHYHGDHSNGLDGFAAEAAPRVRATPTTLELIRASGSGQDDGRGGRTERAALLDAAAALDEDASTEIDLGGRTVRLHPRAGHTSSDVTVELDDPSVVFGGDLLWNGMFPNYRDTTPTVFADAIRALRRERDTVYVPGHGPLAGGAELAHLLAVLGEIEKTSRHAFAHGVTAAEAARGFRLPDSLGRWTLFNDRYFEVAIGAWHRELAASGEAFGPPKPDAAPATG